MSDNEKSKSFWSRPEGKPGMVVLAGLIGVGVYFLYKALPTIIELMQDTLTALGLGIGIFAILTILMNNRFRTTVWYLYKGLMRWFTGVVIEMNPIAILESYVEDIKNKIVKMEEQLTGLKGQIGKIASKLETNRAAFKKEMELASAAKQLGNRDAEVALHTRQAGRLKDYVEKIQSLYNRMEVLYKVLDKMKYYSTIMVKDTEMTVEIKKEERESITKSHSVMKSAMSIINGNNDKKIIFDQAMEFVVDDIGFKVGEMDRMLESSTDFINNVDLDNAVYEGRGLEMLEQFDKQGMDAIFGNKTKGALPIGELYDNLNNLNATPAQPVKIKCSIDSKENKKYF
jgi:hypothetical protein